MSDGSFQAPPPLPQVGVSLKPEHYQDILDEKPKLAFFEIHAENFMSAGGNHYRFLEKICGTYELSVHGVGMSLGSAEGLSKDHMRRLKVLVECFDPLLVSEHLAWSGHQGAYLNDLLPVPLTSESFDLVRSNVDQLQDFLGRQVLIENPSSYLTFRSSHIREIDFLVALAEQTSCGLLMDVNNVFVSGKNVGQEIESYIDQIPADLIGEIHLAGHKTKMMSGEDGRSILIDDHGSAICEQVWQLYSRLIDRVGCKPTLIEWDTDIPDFDVLHQEATKAVSVLSGACAKEKAASD
jgi:uncharacterized protein (UPF0276 family)